MCSPFQGHISRPGEPMSLQLDRQHSAKQQVSHCVSSVMKIVCLPDKQSPPGVSLLFCRPTVQHRVPGCVQEPTLPTAVPLQAIYAAAPDAHLCITAGRGDSCAWQHWHAPPACAEPLCCQLSNLPHGLSTAAAAHDGELSQASPDLACTEHACRQSHHPTQDYERHTIEWKVMPHRNSTRFLKTHSIEASCKQRQQSNWMGSSDDVAPPMTSINFYHAACFLTDCFQR